MTLNKIVNVLDPTNVADVATKSYVDTSVSAAITVASTKKKQVVGLFPPLPNNTPNTGWVASASSEFSSTFSAYNVTQNGEWATNGVTANFSISIKMPSYLQGVEPYGFCVKGRSSGETPNNWSFQVVSGGTATSLYTSSTAISTTTTMYFDINANGIAYKEFKINCLVEC